MKKRIAILSFIFFICIYMTACTRAVDNDADEVNIPELEKNVLTEENKQINTVEPSEEESEKIHIVMAGDMLLHDRIEAGALDENGEYSYTSIFENTKEIINAADIAIANQEVIIGGAELGVSGYPAFNCPYEFGDELVRTGFDVICHGTNHALDKGEKGIMNCKSFWDSSYPQIAVLGVHESAEQSNDVFIYETAQGTNIAILNYTYGTNGINPPEGKGYLVDYLDETEIINDLEYAEANADFTIVCPHWGTEYSTEYNSTQEKWARLFVQNGADLIIGTHPHVIEPIDWVEDEETGKKALVYYSIGNFVNWTSGEGEGVRNRMVGGIADIILKNENGEVEIADYGIVPIVSHVTSAKNGVTVYRLSKYTEELAKENEINKQVSDFSYEFCKELVGRIWDNVQIYE